LGEKSLGAIGPPQLELETRAGITAEMARTSEGNSSFPLPKDESVDVIGALAMLWCAASGPRTFLRNDRRSHPCPRFMTPSLHLI
jgi:hypothetical protein